MEKKGKIRTGIFGGSFNPPHIGHLAIANYICEFEKLDEVWFMVSPHNPFKDESELMSDDLRLKLMQLAIDEYPKFKVSDIEFYLPRPSYSINTLQKLKESYPDRLFTLIIGADNWQVFNKWKDADKIIDSFEIFVYPRGGYEIDELNLPKNVKITNSPIIEISSTFIRESFIEGKDLRFFLPEKVYTELKKHGINKTLFY